jgi:hypothetical protein
MRVYIRDAPAWVLPPPHHHELITFFNTVVLCVFDQDDIQVLEQTVGEGAHSHASQRTSGFT